MRCTEPKENSVFLLGVPRDGEVYSGNSSFFFCQNVLPSIFFKRLTDHRDQTDEGFGPFRLGVGYCPRPISSYPPRVRLVCPLTTRVVQPIPCDRCRCPWDVHDDQESEGGEVGTLRTSTKNCPSRDSIWGLRDFFPR